MRKSETSLCAREGCGCGSCVPQNVLGGMSLKLLEARYSLSSEPGLSVQGCVKAMTIFCSQFSLFLSVTLESAQLPPTLGFSSYVAFPQS